MGKCKNYILRLLFCVIVIIHVTTIQGLAQGISVKISSPAQEYAIGDLIEVNINLGMPVNYRAQWDRHLPTVKDMEESDSMRLDSNLKNNILSYHQRSITQAFDTGNFKIPPIRISILKPNDTSHYLVYTDTLRIKVIGVSTDPKKDIKPIKPPVLVPDVFHIPWLMICIVLLLLALAFLTYKMRNQPPRVISIEQKKSAYEKAMEALKKLEQGGLIKVDMKLYYTTMSDIIRHYLYEAFDIPAPERTTSGTMRAARSRKFSNLIIQPLSDLLKRADLVKFARFHPKEEHGTEDLLKTRFLIENLHLQGLAEEKKL